MENTFEFFDQTGFSVGTSGKFADYWEFRAA
jgi:hypothetical protein